jgi:hypothetical protein
MIEDDRKTVNVKIPSFEDGVHFREYIPTEEPVIGLDDFHINPF